MQPQCGHNVDSRAFQVELIYVYRTKVARGPWPSGCIITHMHSAVWSQLWHNHMFTKHGARVRDGGARGPGYHHLGKFALSLFTPSASLKSESILNPYSMIFPCQVTPTLKPTFCNSNRWYSNKQSHPQCIPKPNAGYHLELILSSSPHGARRDTHHTRSTFIFYCQISSTVCPWETAWKPPQGQLHPCRGF